MTFAEMIKNREWEKIFDILDQGTIEKRLTSMSRSNCYSDDLWSMSGHVQDTLWTPLPEQTNFC